MLSRSVNRPNLIHLLASDKTCQFWDVHLTEEEQQEDGSVWRVKFSEDGSLLALKREKNLEMWKTSTWDRLWSVPCDGSEIDFSPDGLRVLAEDRDNNVHAYDVRSGDALGEVHYTPDSMHDHVHISNEEVGQCETCKSSRLENGEYWFTESDNWLWVVEEGVARRLIHIPAEYNIYDIKGYSSYVAIGCWIWSGLLVLDTGRNSEVV